MKVWIVDFIDERGAVTVDTLVCSTPEKAISELNNLVDKLIQQARITDLCGTYIKEFYSSKKDGYLKKLVYPLVDGLIKIQELEII